AAHRFEPLPRDDDVLSGRPNVAPATLKRSVPPDTGRALAAEEKVERLAARSYRVNRGEPEQRALPLRRRNPLPRGGFDLVHAFEDERSARPERGFGRGDFDLEALISSEAAEATARGARARDDRVEA